jgi:hypothetical protein
MAAIYTMATVINMAMIGVLSLRCQAGSTVDSPVGGKASSIIQLCWTADVRGRKGTGWMPTKLSKVVEVCDTCPYMKG